MVGHPALNTLTANDDEYTFAVTETNDPDGDGNFRKVRSFKCIFIIILLLNVISKARECPTIQITETAFGFCCH